jgi:hypothetical protein
MKILTVFAIIAAVFFGAVALYNRQNPVRTAGADRLLTRNEKIIRVGADSVDVSFDVLPQGSHVNCLVRLLEGDAQVGRHVVVHENQPDHWRTFTSRDIDVSPGSRPDAVKVGCEDR